MQCLLKQSKNGSTNVTVNRVEQVLVPKRKTIYSSRTVKFMQDMVAVISLRFEDEISIESLTEDLNAALNYPYSPDQIVRNLQHLQRSSLVKVDWQRRMIKREKALSEFVKKNVINRETWSNIAADWKKISTFIQSKHKTINNEYQNFLPPKNEND